MSLRSLDTNRMRAHNETFVTNTSTRRIFRRTKSYYKRVLQIEMYINPSDETILQSRCRRHIYLVNVLFRRSPCSVDSR